MRVCVFTLKQLHMDFDGLCRYHLPSRALCETARSMQAIPTAAYSVTVNLLPAGLECLLLCVYTAYTVPLSRQTREAV